MSGLATLTNAAPLEDRSRPKTMTTPNPQVAPIPIRHSVSPKRADHWIVTCADDAVYDSLLVPWLASLMTLARWDGNIVVFDYGLSPGHAAVLRDFGLLVEPVPKRYFVNLDRFLHLAPFAETHPGIIAQWDADVWFTDTIFELFDDYNRREDRRLVCNLDRVFQKSCYWVAREDPAIIEKVRAILEPIIKEQGNVLQCGFIHGASATLAEFCRYLESLIETVEYHPEWNSDTVGLNFWYHYNRDRVRIIDQRYNCIPDWGPERRGSHFHLGDRMMRVLHVTSPWRRIQEGVQFSFQQVHPELYAAWCKRLGA